MAFAKLPKSVPVEASTSFPATLPTSTPLLNVPQPGSRNDDDGRSDSHVHDASMAATPLRESSLASDEDDLFGDGDEDYGDDDQDTPNDQGDISMQSDRQDETASESARDDNDDMIDEEMAAMLNAELEGTGDADDTVRVQSGEPLGGSPAAPVFDLEQPELSQPDTANFDSSSHNVIGVEGGVGMRRLATGQFGHDADDGDSDSTGSSYE